MKNKPENRTNVAPVSDYTSKDGVIKAGTVGTLSYIGGSRGWCFYTGKGHAWDVKAADLFRFVPATELTSATLGHDVAAGEVKGWSVYKPAALDHDAITEYFMNVLNERAKEVTK